jgi:hypothetical protein
MIVYTITVRIPPRPSRLPEFVTRENVSYKHYVPLRDFQIQPNPSHDIQDSFGPSQLYAMKTKQIKIKSHYFPAEMRCQHLQGKTTGRNKGCYFLEKPIKNSRFKCERVDCQGHVFGDKTEMMVRGWRVLGRRGRDWLLSPRKPCLLVLSIVLNLYMLTKL